VFILKHLLALRVINIKSLISKRLLAIRNRTIHKLFFDLIDFKSLPRFVRIDWCPLLGHHPHLGDDSLIAPPHPCPAACQG
jgi:hypothetical protein